jgi:N-methylhydantoinase A/oxoprolinase/acetone carboxylase beta subunit
MDMIIGLDVGGTHTDVVLLGKEGVVRELKVRTEPENLFASVLEGIERITKGIDPAAIERAVLSTTLTTNAIVQGKLPEVGMIVSSGPGINPELFRTNTHYYAVSGSIDHRGREVEAVNRDEILKIGQRLKQAGIENIGIVGKFSVRNPAHEKMIHDLLKDDFEKIFMGHQISGNLNFPRRIATAYLNATVRPIHKNFYGAVKKSLDQKGLKIPLHILKADGGTMNFESSLNFPAQTILSGPSASIMGALVFASEDEDTLALDIGGTTTDMAVLAGGAPLLDPLGIALGEHKTLIRSMETRSIGLGGDSRVRVEDGELRIGPERSGPALAFGGPAPTPTDALFVLGMMEGGDRDASLRGLKPVAETLGLSVEAAASRIFDQVCRMILDQTEDMVSQINQKPVYTVHELRDGFQVKIKKVLVLGGPAPHFAGRLREMSGMNVSVVPRWQVANAIGAALARTTCEVTLFADTEQEVAAAPEEGFNEKADRNFSKETALQKAGELLRQKALKIGADMQNLETETLEELQFNMVRGFYTVGRNIRVKVQVKPGLIRGYKTMAGGLEKAA